MIGMESSLRVITHSKLDSISEGLGSLKVLHESKKKACLMLQLVSVLSVCMQKVGAHHCLKITKNRRML